MIRRISLFFLALATIPALLSCEEDLYQNEGNYIQLKHKGAILPIWIRGNIASGVFIFTIHGGPTSASGHEFTLSDGFQQLEEDFAVVYWDQRESGLAQGYPQDDLQTIDQYVEDTRLVFDLIQQQYAPQSTFLLGHSWGGVLGHSILLDEEVQKLVSGWISVDAMSNDPKEMNEMKRWTLQKADSLIALKENEEFWQYCQQWYQEHPSYSSISVPPYQFAIGAGADVYSYQTFLDSAHIDYSRLAFHSPFSTDYFFSQIKGTRVDYTGWSVADQLHQITIPTLTIWGRHDGIIPVALAYDCFRLYGSPDSNKQLEIFEYSAHSPHFDEPLHFAQKVRAFVLLHRKEGTINN